MPAKPTAPALASATVNPALLRRLDPLLPTACRQLIEAVQNQNLALIQRLRAKGRLPANLRVVNPRDGWTTIMYAAIAGNLEIVRYLLEVGHEAAGPSVDYQGQNVLHITAEYGADDAFQMYAQLFPELIQAMDAAGIRTLHAAAKYGRDELVELLLDWGEEVDQIDRDGSTPLHYAAAYGNISTIDILILRGSRYMIRNHLGWAAADWAYSLQVRTHLEDTAREIYQTRKANPNRLLRRPNPSFSRSPASSTGAGHRHRASSTVSIDSARSGNNIGGGAASSLQSITGSIKGGLATLGLGGTSAASNGSCDPMAMPARPSTDEPRRW